MTSIKDIARWNKASGGYWFDTDTLDYFGTRFETDPIEIGDDFYFVTSEQDRYGGGFAAWDGERRYTIRRSDTEGHITTVSQFGEYSTLDDAIATINRIEQGE